MIPSTARGIRRAWRRYRNVARVATLLCVSESTVARVVGRDATQAPRRVPRTITATMREEIAARRAAGESQAMISLACGIGVERLRAVLAELGLLGRPVAAMCAYCGSRSTTLERVDGDLQCVDGQGCARRPS